MSSCLDCVRAPPSLFLSEDRLLLAAYDGVAADRLAPDRLARLTLMRIVSDFREAMWGVLQQGISSLDIDFVAYATEHFDRLLGAAAEPRFDDALVALGDGSDR